MPAFYLMFMFLIATLSALPSGILRTQRSAEEGGEGQDHNEHLFHGEHLWGLEDYHEGRMKKRSPDEGAEGGDHNEHLFHGEHLWGLEDFHEPAGRL